jgi:hypothetical protein
MLLREPSSIGSRYSAQEVKQGIVAVVTGRVYVEIEKLVFVAAPAL